MTRTVRLFVVRAAVVLTAAALAAGCDGQLPAFSEPTQPQTLRVVAGDAGLVGSGFTSCSHQPARPGEHADRWCAFYRKAAGDPTTAPTELWVLNLQHALAGDAPCDGSSPYCLRLTSTLWTGFSLAAAHPYVHEFTGDTLLFYSDSTNGNADLAFVGPVRAWRPGLAESRLVSNPSGILCVGQLRSDGVICLQNESNAGTVFSFDFLAGTLSGSPVGPLPMLGHIEPYGDNGSVLWQVSFSPDGKQLAFSTKAPDTTGQRLQVVAAADIGRVPPQEILHDVASWQIGPDGRKILYLTGFNYSEDAPSGTLTAADFPAGTGVTPLQPGVGSFQTYADEGGPLRALGLYQDVTESYGTFKLMRDLTRPQELDTVVGHVEEAQVSPDLQYSFYQGHNAAGEEVSQVGRTDGTGTPCELSATPGNFAFSALFLPGQRRVLWAEVAQTTGFNEGWLADPEGCQNKQRFSENLSYFQSTTGGLLYGDSEGSGATMTLKRAPMTAGAVGAGEIIAANVDTTVALVDKRYVLFTVTHGTPETNGLYLHGPLP